MLDDGNSSDNICQNTKQILSAARETLEKFHASTFYDNVSLAQSKTVADSLEQSLDGER